MCCFFVCGNKRWRLLVRLKLHRLKVLRSRTDPGSFSFFLSEAFVVLEYEELKDSVTRVCRAVRD